MAEEVEPALRITLKDVWLAQQETTKQVQSLVEQLPNHVKQTNDDIADIRAVNADQETRLRRLESRVWMAIGGGSLLITAATITISLVNTIT